MATPIVNTPELTQEMRTRLALRALQGISALAKACADSLADTEETAAEEMSHRLKGLADLGISALGDEMQTVDGISKIHCKLYGLGEVFKDSDLQ